jgi:hypothetical protein
LLSASLTCFGQLPQVTMPNNAAVASFIAAHKGYQITVSPGTYTFNNANNAAGLTINNWSGEIDFAPGAQFKCNTYSTKSGWCVNIQNSNNVVLRGVWVGYTSAPAVPMARSKSTTGALQVWNSTNVTSYSSHIDASTGIGFVIGLTTNPKVYQSEVYNTVADGLSFMNDQDAYLEGHYSNNTGDDGLSVLNYAYYNNYTGFTGKSIQVNNSGARGIGVAGQSNVNISNFSVTNTKASGIITLDDLSYNMRRPSNVNWSSGTITAPQLFGIQVDSSDNVTFTSIDVKKANYGGFYACDNTCANINGSDLSFEDTGDGVGLYAAKIAKGTFSGIDIDRSLDYGVYISGSSALTFTNLSIKDTAITGGQGRAWWAENDTGKITVSGLTISDDQPGATGYIVGEYNNPSSSISVTGIVSEIENGTLSIQKSSSGSVFTMANGSTPTPPPTTTPTPPRHHR